MYSPASVKSLSKAQLHKLLKGKPVRVMAGSGMKLHLSKPQHKKLAAAHKRGGGMNLQLDPYQCSMHAKGGDIFEDMLDGLTSAGKKLLNLAPQAAEAIGAPQLVAPINYLVDKYVADKTGEAEKSRARAEAARKPKPAVEPAPFVVDLPAVPRRARRSKGGRLLIDEPMTARQIVNTAKDLALDPLGTIGFGKGGRLLIDEPFTTRQAVNLALDPLTTLGFGLKRKVSKKKGGSLVLPQQLQDLGMAHINRVVPKQVQDLALKQIGMGKPRKPMSDKQKAALAKGRAALAAKRGGALVMPQHHPHKKMSGAALYPAGYKGQALMPAGY
jgi:hypothetical protein